MALQEPVKILSLGTASNLKSFIKALLLTLDEMVAASDASPASSSLRI